MLRRLFGARTGPAAADAPLAPANSRIYAIGDIHGRADLLRRLHARILDDAAGAGVSRRVAVYLGDYVDRGESSRQVLDLLLDEPLPGFESVFLSGNHEEMMLGFLESPTMAAIWLHNGGDATLYSYGIAIAAGPTPEERHAAMRDALRGAVPERHLDFLLRLGSYHVEGGYLFVHAGIRPGVPLDQQRSEDLLWIREAFLESRADHGYCVVHGHTIVQEPEFRPNRIAIDTGAFFSDRLTCLILEGADRRTMQT